MIATPRRIPSWNDKHQYATRAFGSGDGNMPPREAGEPITDQSMARQLGLAASENKKHLRQRTATIRREQTAKNATNLFRNSSCAANRSLVLLLLSCLTPWMHWYTGLDLLIRAP
jgi:hypothetical protein